MKLTNRGAEARSGTDKGLEALGKRAVEDEMISGLQDDWA
jgi:hypothetical protein